MSATKVKCQVVKLRFAYFISLSNRNLYHNAISSILELKNKLEIFKFGAQSIIEIGENYKT